MNLFKNENDLSENDIIEEGDVFHGDIESQTCVEINGEVSGEKLKSIKTIIGKNGLLKSEIYTRLFILDGTFIGNIKQTERAILNSTGKLLGNISTKELITSEGVMIQGQVLVSVGDVNNIEEDILQSTNNQSQSQNQNTVHGNKGTDSGAGTAGVQTGVEVKLQAEH